MREIFAQNLFLQGYFEPARPIPLITCFYQTLAEFLPPPDLVIYLRASVSTLQRRITSRDRDYETYHQPDLPGKVERPV